MSIEQKWPAVAPRLFTANGTQFGIITVASTKGFKVKQKVALSSTALMSSQFRIIRVLSETQLKVGLVNPPQGQWFKGEDVSAWTVAGGAYIYAEEQDKAKLKPEDIIQAIYDQEPTVALRNVLVDQFGEYFDSVVDASGIRRLAVDAHADVDVKIDIDGVYNPITNPDPDNVGLIAHTRSDPTNETHQVQRITAIRGTVNNDTVSQDVSLHDHNGNALSYNAGVSDATTLRGAVNIKKEGAELDYDFGASSALTLRIAALVGNATGSADFNGGLTTAQTLRVVLPTDQTPIPVTQSGAWTILISNFPATVDTNYGVVGANTLRTASQIGNATGAANFDDGVSGAQTLRTTSNLKREGNDLDYDFGASSANTLRIASLIGNTTGAADFNTGVTGTQTLRSVSNIQRDGNELSYNLGAPDTNTLRVASILSNAVGQIDYDYGVVGTQTIRTASQIGNATGSADFNSGLTTAQTLRVVLPTDQTAIPVAQFGTWSVGRTWSLTSGTDSATVIQGTSPWIISGAVTQSGSWTVNVSNFPATVDTNYGIVGANTIRTASQIGNATGSAAFGAGTTTAQTLRVVLPTDQTAIPVTQSGVWTINVGVPDKTSFIYGTTSELPVGGVYQDTAPSLTSGTTGALRLTASRGLHTNLRNSSGNEITSAVNDLISNKLLLHTQTPDTTTTTTALGALNANVTISETGLTSIGFQILAGTFIGTLTPEISIDGGTTWFATNFYDFTLASVSSFHTFSSANTTKMLTVITLGGTTHARVRVSAYTSGTANALMSASHGVGVTVTPAGAGGGAAAYGTITNTFVTIPNNTATLVLAANSSRKYAYISNGSGSLVFIQFASGTGLSTTTGLPIPARTFYELKGDNLFTGNIYAFSSSSVTLSLAEGTP